MAPATRPSPSRRDADPLDDLLGQGYHCICGSWSLFSTDPLNDGAPWFCASCGILTDLQAMLEEHASRPPYADSTSHLVPSELGFKWWREERQAALGRSLTDLEVFDDWKAAHNAV